MIKETRFYVLLILTWASCNLGATEISGEMKLWYPVTISFDGPEACEETNTFRDIRLDVTFPKGGRRLVVPGYFAVDGDAAKSSATSGNTWRVKFTPDATGIWQYQVSFRVGKDVAASLDPLAGKPGLRDGIKGEFAIQSRDAQAPGFYAKGKLRYVDEHYLQFADSGEWFAKAGPGSPEDFLGYADFDGTFDRGGTMNDSSLGEDGLHNYAAHEKDWRLGDPTWKDGKGKGIIGALNYLASTGCNTIYNILLTINGDADTTWPWTEPNKLLPKEDGKARLGFWKVVMAGGEGLDIYTAYILKDYSDITIEDFRRLDSVWQQLAYGLQFFQRPEVNRELPTMVTLIGKVSQGYCFANPGILYVVYTRNAEGLTLDLSNVTGDFTVRWYDPARGGTLQTGSVLT